MRGEMTTIKKTHRDGWESDGGRPRKNVRCAELLTWAYKFFERIPWRGYNL
jgi:hypothetical protein